MKDSRDAEDAIQQLDRYSFVMSPTLLSCKEISIKSGPAGMSYACVCHMLMFCRVEFGHRRRPLRVQWAKVHAMQSIVVKLVIASSKPMYCLRL